MLFLEQYYEYRISSELTVLIRACVGEKHDILRCIRHFLPATIQKKEILFQSGIISCFYIVLYLGNIPKWLIICSCRRAVCYCRSIFQIVNAAKSCLCHILPPYGVLNGFFIVNLQVSPWNVTVSLCIFMISSATFDMYPRNEKSPFVLGRIKS